MVYIFEKSKHRLLVVANSTQGARDTMEENFADGKDYTLVDIPLEIHESVFSWPAGVERISANERQVLELYDSGKTLEEIASFTHQGYKRVQEIALKYR